MNLKKTRLTVDREADWREVVQGDDASTPFHSLAWKRVVESTFDYDSHYLLWYDGSDPVAALPAFSVPELGGNSLTNPFCEYGHPVTKNATVAAKVLADLKGWPGQFDAVVVKDATWTGIRGYSPASYGGTETGTVRRLPLSRPFEDLRELVFDGSLRTNVRKATESGLRVETASTSSRYYDLYLETMKRLGSPQFPQSFFDALNHEFGANSRILLALDDADAVAGLHYLQWEGTCSVWSNASQSDAWKRRPNDLLYVDAIRRATETGARVVDFGRSEPGGGVDGFKRQFGAPAFPTTSYVYPPRYTTRASVSSYKQLAPVARALSPIITHSTVGPRLKRWIHE